MVYFTAFVGLVRLVSSEINLHNSLSGTVEVWSNGKWGSVCSGILRGWDLREATVVCRQLGYRYAHSAHLYASFGRSSGPIWLSEVVCTGDESSILNCHHQGIGWLHGCYHYQDVGAICLKGKHPMQIVRNSKNTRCT